MHDSYLISQLPSMQDDAVPLLNEVCAAKGLRADLVHIIMPLMSDEFFFFLEEESGMLFVCDEHTMKRLWQGDQDYRNDLPDGNPSGGYLTLLVSLPSWWLFNDAYRWDDFTKDVKDFEKISP